MTKNNLTDHLPWLLQSASAIVPHSPSTRPLDVVAFAGSSNSFASTPPTGNSAPLPFTIPAQSVKVPDTDAVSEFAKPNLPASLLKAQSRNDMARLQTSTKTSNKPQLLSETLPAYLQTPLPSSVRGPSTSLSVQYSQGLLRQCYPLRFPISS